MSWLFNPFERGAFHDKAWKRDELVAWDEHWAGLSAAARRHFVEDVKAAVRKESQPPTTPANKPAMERAVHWTDWIWPVIPRGCPASTARASMATSVMAMPIPAISNSQPTWLRSGWVELVSTSQRND